MSDHGKGNIKCKEGNTSKTICIGARKSKIIRENFTSKMGYRIAALKPSAIKLSVDKRNTTKTDAFRG